MAQWFADIDGKVFGPFATSKLRRLAAAGKIKPQHRISKSRTGPWQSAGKVQGLFAAPAIDTPAQAVSTAFVAPAEPEAPAPATPVAPPVTPPPVTPPPVQPPPEPTRSSPVRLWAWWHDLSPIRRRRVLRRVMATGCVIASLVLIVGRFRQAYNTEPETPPRAAPLSDSELAAEGMVELSQDGVRAFLLSPSSAVFGEFEAKPLLYAQYVGRDVWSFTGSVDSQNAFGVMLRMTYTTYISYDSVTGKAICEAVVLGDDVAHETPWSEETIGLRKIFAMVNEMDPPD